MQDSHKVKFLGSLLVSVLLTSNFFAASFLESSGFTWWLLPIFTFLILFIWEWGAWVSRKLDPKYSWSLNFGKRLVLQLIGTSAGALILFNIIYSAYKFYGVYYNNEVYTIYIVLLVNSFLLIFSLLVTGMQLSIHFLNRWRWAELETEQYKRETVKAQLEALKSQIDPHFLFNNFNTLYGLIQESPKQATDYLLHLSEIYRYVLHNREQEAVTLATEVKMAKAYLFLLQNRFEKALQVQWQLPESIFELFIIPLTLQILIENAVKHNRLEEETPLTIQISLRRDNYLVVCNSVNKRNNITSSTKLGLAQLKQRYRLLTDRELEVIDNGTKFKVCFPLLRDRDGCGY